MNVGTTGDMEKVRIMLDFQCKQLCSNTEGKGTSVEKIEFPLGYVDFAVSMGNQEKKSRKQYSEISTSWREKCGGHPYEDTNRSYRSK